MGLIRWRRARPIVRGLVALAFVSLLGACGGDDDDKATSGTKTSGTSGGSTTSDAGGSPTSSDDGDADATGGDPCALLTPAQATEAFGEAPGKPYRDGKACTWTVGSDTPQFGSGKPYIRITIEDDIVYGFRSDDGTPVRGIGDEAFDYEGTLYIKDGDRYFGIYLGAMSDDPRETVAKHVLENA